MMPGTVALDFIDRTITNLETILAIPELQYGPFHTTQIINSFLSVLIHSKELKQSRNGGQIAEVFKPQMKAHTLGEAENHWNFPKSVTESEFFSDADDIYKLVDRFRHALAHRDLVPIGNRVDDQIHAIRLQNTNRRYALWSIDIAIADLHQLLYGLQLMFRDFYRELQKRG